MSSSVPYPQLVADLIVFAKVVERGTFTAAADELGLAKSQVTKQVRRLESSLEVTLLHRTTRRMALTDAGASIHQHALVVSHTAGAVLDQAAQHLAQPTGLLRVSASVAYGLNVLAPILPEFHKRNPKVELELVLVDRYVDLLEEGVDVAIRLTAEPEPSLAGRPLHKIAFNVCCTPHFAKANPVEHPCQLGGLPCIVFNAQNRRSGATWHFSRGRERASVDVAGPIYVNSSDVIKEVMLSGIGVGLIPDFVARKELATGDLVPILTEWTPTGPLGPTAWVLWQPQRAMPPKMRVFIDFLVHRLSDSEAVHQERSR